MGEGFEAKVAKLAEFRRVRVGREVEDTLCGAIVAE